MYLMEVFLLSILLLVTLFYFYSLFKHNQNNAAQNLPLPPGNLYWPLKYFETLDYLSKAKKDTIHQFFVERKNKYSTKLFKTSHLGQNMVFLCSPDANKFLFANDYKLVRSWWPDTFLKVFENADDEMTMEQVMRARKQFLSFFNEPEALARHVGITHEVVRDHFKSYWEGNDEVTVAPLARKLTFAVSCCLLADIKDQEILNKLLPLMGSIVDALFAYPINFPGTKFNGAIKGSRKAREIFLDIIKERKIELSEKKNSVSNDIVSRILMENYREGKEVNDIVLAKNLVALLSSAYDNPSLVMVSIMKTLAEQPQIYDNVRREQMEIANSKGPEEHLSMEDIKKMKYSMNVINETLRLEPPASGTFREALTDFNYEGFRIPKGWKIHWSVHATNRNPEYFSNPEEFDPSRFERNEPKVPYSYVPFGGGHHTCPGKDFAKLQILVFMHHVVTKFKWEKVSPDEKMTRNPSLTAAKGLPVRLHPIHAIN